jgi:uncharacterized membrane protein YeaQ/YmgE (transglycosylase-associated protein family)
MLDTLKAAWRTRRAWRAIQDARKEGVMGAKLKVVGHVLALAAPAVGALVAEQLAKALSSSHDQVAMAIGSLLGALVPLLRNIQTKE